MSGAASAFVLDIDTTAQSGVVDDLLLARVAAEAGATRADLLRDLAPLCSHRLSPSELRSRIDAAIGALVAGTLLHETRGRYRLAEPLPAPLPARLPAPPTGRLTEWLGTRKLPVAWPAIRDVRLVAAALDLAAEPAMLKALSRPEGLRAAILQQAYAIGGKRLMGASRLRMALAVIALERAFGNKIKSGLDAGRGLSVKASRLLAGQLARRPRDFGTDTRLIAALAAEAVGAAQADPGSLRQAVLRRYVSERLDAERPAHAPTHPTIERAASAIAPPAGAATSSGVVASVPASSRPAAANRPDLDGFAREVLRAASAVAEGWPGNRKAYISRVWQVVATAHPQWGLSDIEFKSMLAEAHRTGHIVLASADIKHKDTLRDVQDSAIAYKNTVWHFVRVET